MNILLIHTRYQQYGGEDTVFDNEVELLNKNGYTIQTIVFSNILKRNFLLRFLQPFSMIFSLTSLVRVILEILRFKPDVIHIHNLFYTASPSVLWGAYLLQIPVVLTLHNFRLLCPKATFLRNNSICELCRLQQFPWDGIKYRCFKNSALITCILSFTLFLHKILGTWRITVSRYITLSSFATEIFQKSALNIEPDKFIIKPNWTQKRNHNLSNIGKDHFLYVGRLSEEKGIQFLRKFFFNSGKKLLIIGDGPLKESSKKKPGNIIFLGSMSKDAVYHYMTGAKALIVPSVWYEMFPMVVVEAFSAGTPVIASRIGALPVIVQHNKNGLLFDVNDARQLTSCINALDNEKLYRELCKNAYDEYLLKYTEDAALNDLRCIYENIFKKK